MFSSLLLRGVLKRGALVAAANWPVAIVQATADSLFKLLMLVPLVGGVFLVALVVGAEPVELMSLEWRDLALTIAASLLVRPVVLATWVAALAVVLGGGSLLVFLVKGGTIGVLVTGERQAGAIERSPIRPESIASATAFSIEAFIAAARQLFPRYARLGLGLIVVYLASGAVYAVLLGRSAAVGWGLTALLTVAFAAWITLVNFVYLLAQIVIATDHCAVVAALARVSRFLRRESRTVGAVFLVVLALVILATGASVLVVGALWLVGFVPFVGLAVLPLQIAAWILRALVFQYIGLASVGAYARLYRAGGVHDAVVERLATAEVS